MENETGQKNILPRIKKNIKTFLTSEDGKVSRKGLVAGATLLFMVGIASEAYGHGSHANSNIYNPSGAAGYHNSHATHGSHGSHASHGSHGSHGSW